MYVHFIRYGMKILLNVLIYKYPRIPLSEMLLIILKGSIVNCNNNNYYYFLFFNRYVVVSGTPTFIVLVTNSDFKNQFIKINDNH